MIDLYSLLKFTKNIKKVYLFVETENINDIEYLESLKKKFEIEFELINYNKYCYGYLSTESPNKGSMFTDFCFSKLVLADFIKEDKVIYLDTDAIVRKDISNLWNYPIDNYYVLGVKDYGVMSENYLESLNLNGKYINSGVVV